MSRVCLLTGVNSQVTASEKGLVVGRIQFDDDADFIDCTKMGRSGKNIPSYIDRVSNIK